MSLPDLKACLFSNPHALLQSVRLKAAALKGSLWPQSSTIKVGFIKQAFSYNGSTLEPEYTKEKADWVERTIMKYVDPLVNLSFMWDVPLEEADVRITFVKALGSWSTLGKQARDVPREEPTMNLGWLDQNQEDSANSITQGTGQVVIHEFGHLCGLIHEHSSPSAADQIVWNKDLIYASLSGPPNSWSKEMIDYNVMFSYDKESVNASAYDPKSIMHYVFPKEFFIKGPDLTQNITLSPLDKQWLSMMYPTKGLAMNEDTPKPKNMKWILLLIIGVIIIFAYLKYRRRV